MAVPIVDSLGASGYPALQTFLSHILDSKSRALLLSSKRFFLILMAMATLEMVEEAL